MKNKNIDYLKGKVNANQFIIEQLQKINKELKKEIVELYRNELGGENI